MMQMNKRRRKKNKRKLVSKICDFYVSEGIAETTTGNWIVYYDSIINNFPQMTVSDLVVLSEYLESKFLSRKEISDVESTATGDINDVAFDLWFHGDYCTNSMY
jgi:hypothetical protein